MFTLGEEKILQHPALGEKNLIADVPQYLNPSFPSHRPGMGVRVTHTLSGCCLKQARPRERMERVLAA